MAPKALTAMQLICNHLSKVQVLVGAPMQTAEERRAYYKKWYENNKKRRIELNKRWKDKRKQEFYDFKSSLFCAHCGENEPVCLDFHHEDDGKKEVNIANVIACWSEEKIKKEIAKCIVLCSNCHRKEHKRLREKWEINPV